MRTNSGKIFIGLFYALSFALYAIILSGCGPGYEYNRARHLEENEYYVQAAMKYEEIFKKYPEEVISAEALYRAGNIYQKKLQLYSKANIVFTKILEYYSTVQPWVRMAEISLFDCPDYFPLSNGSFWIEGDSKTNGQNMRAEWTCQDVSENVFKIRKKYSAGARVVTEFSRYYTKKNFELKESEDKDFKNSTKVLVYPFAPGRSWTTIKDGSKVTYKIIEKDVDLKVVAGEFSGCIKISEQNPLFPNAIKNYYFAPQVGWVLTTTSVVDGQEHRSSELLSYKIKETKPVKEQEKQKKEGKQ